MTVVEDWYLERYLKRKTKHSAGLDYGDQTLHSQQFKARLFLQKEEVRIFTAEMQLKHSFIWLQFWLWDGTSQNEALHGEEQPPDQGAAAVHRGPRNQQL